MSEPIPDDSSARYGPRQFSLRTLFVLLSLVAVVSAAFTWHEFAGIWVYLGCLLLVLSVWRHRQLRALIDRPDPPAHLRLVDPASVALGTLAIALCAGIAFCCTCTFVQIPFAQIHDASDADVAARAMNEFRKGLLVSIPCGTVVVLLIYAMWWPHESDSPPTPRQTTADQQ